MRDLIYLGSSFDDLMAFPADVREEVLFALEIALDGGKAPAVKPLTGFKGASVLEVVESYDGDAYRAVYTVRYRHAVYVLHAFKKKSKSGKATPRNEIVDRPTAQAGGGRRGEADEGRLINGRCTRQSQQRERL